MSAEGMFRAIGYEKAEPTFGLTGFRNGSREVVVNNSDGYAHCIDRHHNVLQAMSPDELIASAQYVREIKNKSCVKSKLMSPSGWMPFVDEEVESRG